MEGKLAIRYERLKVLLSWRWEDNPKLHQDNLLESSIRTHGFNDSVGVDYDHQIVSEGHGRLERLKALFDFDPRSFPRNILPVLAEHAPEEIPAGVLSEHPVFPGFLRTELEVLDWLVPTTELVFETKEDAMRYALVHNRAGVSKLLPEDYSGEKLRRALTKARGEQAQLSIPGFGDEDLMMGGSVSRGALSLPPLPSFDEQPGTQYQPFDASGLPDAPGYQMGQAQQSFTVLLTVASWENLKRVLRALTLGQRTGLPAGARYASLDGEPFLERWETALVGGAPLAAQAEVRPQSQALEGQIAVDGSVVGAPGLVLPMPDWDNAPSSEPSEPKWSGSGQLCDTCGGSGYTGFRSIGGVRSKVVCGICGGAGDRESWLRMHSGSAPEAPVSESENTAGETEELPF